MQKGPLWVLGFGKPRGWGPGGIFARDQVRFLKRQLSLPVSMISQYPRSTRASTSDRAFDNTQAVLDELVI